MSEILVLPATHAPSLPEQACWQAPTLDFLDHAGWHSRPAAEQDPRWLQLIPYVLLRNPAGLLWSYRRDGGDPRLEQRASCGLGGHVERCDEAADIPATLLNGARRELAEELGLPRASLHPRFTGALVFEGLSAIGRMHLGLLYLLDWPAGREPLPPPGEPIAPIGFLPPQAIISASRFELWSRLAARHLLEKPVP